MRIAISALLVACGAAPPPVVHVAAEPSPILEPIEAPIVVGPIAHAATSYGEPLDGGGDAMSAEIFEGLATFASGHGELTRDARLDAVAGELAAAVARGGSITDDGLVEFVLDAHGVVEPAARVIAIRGQSTTELVEAATAQLGDSLMFGNVNIGIAGAIVVVTHRALVTLDRVPRFVPRHGEIELAGTLDPSFHAPRVTITHDDRRVEHPKVIARGNGEFRAPFGCGDRSGTQWVLVEGCDAQNAVYRLALVPISCGTPPATTFRLEPISNLATEDLERRLTTIVNRERAAAKLPLVVADPRATAAARIYADAMRRAGNVDHELGHTTPATRMQAAGLIPPYMLEATLQASSLGRASEILMNDPVYRADLVSPAVTHVGVGVARDAHGELYIAIELVQIAPAIDPVEVRDALLAKIRATSPMANQARIDRLLQKLADRYATSLAEGWREDTLWATLVKDVNLAFARYKHAKKATVVVLDPATLDAETIIAGRTFHDLGIAIAQSGRDGPLAGRIWVVVFFGQRDEFLESSRTARSHHAE